MAKSIIKESEVIRGCLELRIKELNLTLSAICLDAKKNKSNINIASLSKYFKKSLSNNLTEEQILWLCTRYMIPVTLIVGNAQIKENKLKFILPEYNEKEAIVAIKSKFKHERKKTMVKQQKFQKVDE